MKNKTPQIIFLPKAAGECPQAVSKRHTTSDAVGRSICILCLKSLND